MTTAAIVVAAGRGMRAGAGLPKQWRPLGRSVVVQYSLALFAAHPAISTVVLVVHPDDMGRARTFCPGVEMVTGGHSRAQSVRNALEALDGRGISNVLIHDGARPFATPALLDRLLVALRSGPAAAPALPVTDALWHSQDGRVTRVQPRAGLMRAQTPQAFHFAAILDAHRSLHADAADDVEVAMAAGLDVAVVGGEEDNIKLTHAEDFARAERILNNGQVSGLG